VGRSGRTGFSEDDGLLPHLGLYILMNDTGSEKAVSRISTFFFPETFWPLACLVGLKGKEMKNSVRAKKLGFPFSRQVLGNSRFFSLFSLTPVVP